MKKAINECGTEIDFVVAVYTSKLQVMDVGLNWPFKDGLREVFEKLMVSSTTAKPIRLDVAIWVSNAWNGITTIAILNSWSKVLGMNDKLDSYEIVYDGNDDDNSDGEFFLDIIVSVTQIKDPVPDSQQVVVAEEDAVNEAEENEERWTILEATTGSRNNN